MKYNTQAAEQTSTIVAQESESYFSFEELFFSRTDKKGTIQSGNEVFKRVSQYEWDELINKPHNLIRHQDMPRGVFQLFWDTIRQDKPIAAYVKNKAKSGDYYWVFALALPVDDGFVSIRLKPSSHFFEVIQSEYKKLSALEISQNLNPLESKELLLKTIASLGFQTYEDFMVTALMAELEERQKKINKQQIKALLYFSKILKDSAQLLEKSNSLLKSFKQNSYIPLNLEIKSTTVGSDGAPLAVVANQYEQMGKEIYNEIIKFDASTSKTKSFIQSSQYYLCANTLEKEIIAFFKNESQDLPFDVEQELSVLNSLYQEGRNKALESINELNKEFSTFVFICDKLKTLATGLDIVRLTGKIEIARLNTAKTDLDTLISELYSFREVLKVLLDDLSTISHSLCDTTKQVLSEVHLR